MKKMKKIIALALMALSLMAVALPALAVNYTIQAPAGSSGSLIVRKTGSKSGTSLGNIGSGSKVDISDPTVNSDGYVAVTILSVTNGGNNQFVMGTNGNKGYILATWVSGFTGGTNPGTNPTNPPSGNGTSRTGIIRLDSGSLNVRSAPGTGSLGSLYKGDVVTYYRDTATYSGGMWWVKVASSRISGGIGWISANYLNHGNSLSSNPTECTICGNGLTSGTTTRTIDQYNTVSGYHYHNGVNSLCSQKPVTYKTPFSCGTSGHPVQYSVSNLMVWNCQL